MLLFYFSFLLGAFSINQFHTRMLNISDDQSQLHTSRLVGYLSSHIIKRLCNIYFHYILFCFILKLTFQDSLRSMLRRRPYKYCSCQKRDIFRELNSMSKGNYLHNKACIQLLGTQFFSSPLTKKKTMLTLLASSNT